MSEYAKYFQMMKMGVPRDAVGQKMAADEVPSQHVRVFKAGPRGVEQGLYKCATDCGKCRCNEVSNEVNGTLLTAISMPVTNASPAAWMSRTLIDMKPLPA